MSGAAVLARLNAIRESRLLTPSSPSPCRGTRRRASSSCTGSRAGGGDVRGSSLACYARRDASSDTVLRPLRPDRGRKNASNTRLVRALSSTLTPSYPPTPITQNRPHDTEFSKPSRGTKVTKTDDISKPVSVDTCWTARDPACPLSEKQSLFLRSMLWQALRHRRPAAILKAIVTASNHPDFLQSIPDTTFFEIISLINPQKAIKWAKVVQQSFSAALVEQMRITSPKDIVHEYLYTILKMVTARKAAGRALNVNDYANLLETAHMTHSKPVAKSLWQAMQADRVVPDLRCYNSYLGAIVQNAGKLSKHSHRITTYHKEVRSRSTCGSGYAAYGYGEGGIREETLGLLDQMLNSELSPNVETFRLVILGVAREGDLTTVEGLSKNIWGVNVRALMNNADESQLSPRKDIPRTSPLYPHAKLLQAIAHAFSINNKISMAIRLVDYVSRSFNITMSKDLWEELFLWTFMLAKPRYGQCKFTVGQIPKKSVLQLWTTMTNAPYNIRPSMTMYNHLIKMLSLSCRANEMWIYIQEGLLLYKDSRKKAHEAQLRLEQAIFLQSQNTAVRSVSIEKHRESFVLLEMLRKRNRYMVNRWIRLLLGTTRVGHKADKDQYWSSIQIPRVLEAVSACVPRVVSYDIPGGRVEIVFRERSEIYDSHQRRLKLLTLKEAAINVVSTPPGTRIELGRKVLLGREPAELEHQIRGGAKEVAPST